MTNDPPASHPRGTIAGRFRVEREVRSTESGVVYDGFEIATGRNVTLEIATGLADEASRSRFVRDAVLAQRLDGEHVLRVVDAGALPDGVPWVAHERAVTSLADEILARGSIAPPIAVAWTLEVAEAVAEGHALGMAHGDVRPGTVFLARGRGEIPAAKLSWTSAKKAERLAREDVARDIAGLGALLRMLLTGTLTPSEPEDDDAATTLPSELSHVVARAMTTDPEGRFANVAELARALAPFAPPGHESARNVSFMLSRAGIIGAPMAGTSAAPASAQAARANGPERLSDEWFRPSRSSIVPRRRDRGGIFALVSLGLLALVGIATIALHRTGALPRWTGAAPPLEFGETTLTSGEIDTVNDADRVTIDAVERWSAVLPPIDEHDSPHLSPLGRPLRVAPAAHETAPATNGERAPREPAQPSEPSTGSARARVPAPASPASPPMGIERDTTSGSKANAAPDEPTEDTPSPESAAPAPSQDLPRRGPGY
jgi:serine/threonine-protein kinase